MAVERSAQPSRGVQAKRPRKKASMRVVKFQKKKSKTGLTVTCVGRRKTVAKSKPVKPASGNIRKRMYSNPVRASLEEEFQKSVGSGLSMEDYLKLLAESHFEDMITKTDLTSQQIRQWMNNRKARPPVRAGFPRPRGSASAS